MVISMLSLKSEVRSGATKEVGGQRESGKVFCMNLVFFTEVSPCLHLFGFIKDENVKMRQDSHVNEAVGKGSEEKKGKKMEGNFFGCFLEEKKPTPATQKHSPPTTRTNQVER